MSMDKADSTLDITIQVLDREPRKVAGTTNGRDWAFMAVQGGFIGEEGVMDRFEFQADVDKVPAPGLYKVHKESVTVQPDKGGRMRLLLAGRLRLVPVPAVAK
jgi:hypothetical protein